MIRVSQVDLNGNIVETVAQGAQSAPGRLATMAATGADMRLLLIVLIMMELPASALLSAAGC